MNTVTNNNIKCTIALASLQNVLDPEIGLNVVDLGLIYQIDFDDADSKINVVMTLTTHFCPMGESITDGVKRALENIFTGMEVHLELTYDPPWTFSMISEEGQKFFER
jgi:metal-sulfur cluster biosynthetic enzyme